MRIRFSALGVGLAAIAATAVLTPRQPAQALTAKECSAKFQAAKTAGTLSGMKWNDFRKTECGSDTSAAPAPGAAAVPAAATGAAAAAPAAAANPATAPKPAGAPGQGAAAAPAAVGNAVFPTAVSPKYASEPAGKARMHTCRDQYSANKPNAANGGLKWIQKGGGYYSECTKQLKGAV